MGVSLIQHGSPPIGVDPEGNPMGQENTLNHFGGPSKSTNRKNKSHVCVIIITQHYMALMSLSLALSSIGIMGNN